MKRQFQQRKRVVVYLDAEEYAELERQAGGRVTSAFARKRLLGTAPKIIKTPDDVENLVRAPKVKRTAKTCVHGMKQGYNCWQCGGIARVAAEA